MMNRKISLLISCLLTTMAWGQTIDVDKQLGYCHYKVSKAMKSFNGDYSQIPRNILSTDNGEKWNCRKACAEEWCSGFWPGVLWMDYKAQNIMKKDGKGLSTEDVKKAAEGYTEALRPITAQPAYDHDLGFIVINSLLKGYEATGREDYKKAALQAADTLATLYNAKVGTILSWPRHVKDYGGHNTIMDNMINLELLFWASQNGGSTLLRDIAVAHAITTMRNHFRPDGSCYHVAVYDTKTGDFLRGQTHQGYADYSMWSRGQSWAIYGYTMVYRYTHDPVFLEFAQKVTDVYLRRLKETSDDMVPLWDMDDPRGIGAPKDASTACVVASALIELSQYFSDYRRDMYLNEAKKMIADLAGTKYLSGEKNVAFLLHSTGHHPAGSEIDASIVYADYYFIEALLRLRQVERK